MSRTSRAVAPHPVVRHRRSRPAPAGRPCHSHASAARSHRPARIPTGHRAPSRPVDAMPVCRPRPARTHRRRADPVRAEDGGRGPNPDAPTSRTTVRTRRTRTRTTRAATDSRPGDPARPTGCRPVSTPLARSRPGSFRRRTRASLTPRSSSAGLRTLRCRRIHTPGCRIRRVRTARVRRVVRRTRRGQDGRSARPIGSRSPTRSPARPRHTERPGARPRRRTASRGSHTRDRHARPRGHCRPSDPMAGRCGCRLGRRPAVGGR
jgi:hypothetical protein